MASTKKEKAPVAESSKPAPATPAKVAAKKVAAKKAVAKKLVATSATAKAAPAAAAKTLAVVPTAPAAKPVAKPAAKPKLAAKKVGKVEGPAVDQAQRANYIEVAAYYIAQRRGFTPGDAEQDYLNAAAEVDQLIAAGHFSK